MPIKKRIKPEPKRKPRRKLSEHELVCRTLYNRLQNDINNESIKYVLGEIVPIKMNAYSALKWIMAQCDTTVNTLQINGYSKSKSYRVAMTYTDRTKKPKNGYLYPTVSVVKTSSELIVSAILAYIELAKHLERWPHEKT